MSRALPCSCDRADYCDRMRMDMRERPRFYELCRDREDYRALWEASAHGLPIPLVSQTRPCRHLEVSPSAGPRDCLQSFVHRCDIHGWCWLNAPDHRTGPTCTRCERYEPRFRSAIEPMKVVRIDSSTLDGANPKLNAALIEHRGRLYLGYRAGWGHASIGIAELDPDHLTPRWSKVLSTDPRSHGHVGWEDPRLFLYNDRIHFSFTGWGGPQNPIAQVLVGRLDDDFEFECVWRPDYPDSQVLEKNWGFFESDGQLLSVYTIYPHRILQLHDDGTASALVTTNHSLPWDFGIPRGGAAPVRQGDEYYSFFHGVRWRPGGGRCYSMGCYTFEAQYPYRIRRMTPEPLLVPDDQHMQQHMYAVVFPCGAVLRDDRWEISYGHQDCEIRVAMYSQIAVESALVPVS